MNEKNKPNPGLGNHCWLLGTDVWQLGSEKERLKKLFPQSPNLTKLVQIAQVLDKYQQEIIYYQTRIRTILQNLEKKPDAEKKSAKKHQ